MIRRLNEKTKGEEGSALILAVLITVILSLLWISYLLMAQTESTIAENERNSVLSLFTPVRHQRPERPVPPGHQP